MNVDWMFAFTVLVTGILVVFLVLLLLVLLISVMGKVISSISGQGTPSSGKTSSTAPAAAPKAPAPAPKAQAAPVVPSQDDLGDDVIAVISAAIAAVMDEQGIPEGSYTVKSIKRAREARPVWAMAGMQQNTRPF